MGKRRRQERQDATVAAADGLSSLPDELLRHILSFVPAKEGASTCVLSRRWRTLWHTSGAVNLYSRSYSTSTKTSHSGARRVRRRFIRGAEAALAAAHAHSVRVRKLTVHAETVITPSLNQRRFRALFSGRAARHVEELHAEVTPYMPRGAREREQLYKLSFRKLPSQALRELHVTGFSQLTPLLSSAGAAFPRVSYLHLKDCIVTFRRLQLIVDASPQLATLHLEYSTFPRVENVTEARKKNRTFQTGYGFYMNNPSIGEEPCYRLVCPTITALFFAEYDGISMTNFEGGLELEASRLRYIRYHGVLLVNGQHLLKVLGSSNVIQADLHITHLEKGFFVYYWQFLHGFITAKVLRLKMDFAIDDVAIDKQGGPDDLVGNKFFPNLEFLELEGYYEPTSRTAAVAIANFLYCCPVLHSLHLKLKMRSIIPLQPNSVRTQARLDFSKSVDRFKHRRRAMILLGGEDDWNNDEVSDIPGLSDHSFDCLQSSLRTVRLQFWMEKPKSFRVQVAKFFVDNAVLLEEMQIDDGNLMMHEHMNRWVSERRKSLNITSARETYPPSKRQKK